jgi:hypothetical protein
MRTKYEFKKEVGQVVGGDSKTNTAQTHVDLHMHLEGWLRHETAIQPSTNASVQSIDSAEGRARPYDEAGTNSAMRLAAGQAYGPSGALVVGPRSAFANNLAFTYVLAVAVCVVAVGAFVYAVVQHKTPPQPHSIAAEAPNCEYGGDRYSLGSVVMQAGVRRFCVSVDRSGATWQNVETERQF